MGDDDVRAGGDGLGRAGAELHAVAPDLDDDLAVGAAGDGGDHDTGGADEVLGAGRTVGGCVAHRPRHGCGEGGHQHAGQDADEHRPAEAEVGERHEGAAGEAERAGETADRRGGQQSPGGPLQAVEDAVEHVAEEQ